ncbi:hypothetical protein F5B18DRAFT_116869 [Nemania serpens]|nr:hypothetical protein F5B18DRAFT_116869 [Nemania serpens]
MKCLLVRSLECGRGTSWVGASSSSIARLSASVRISASGFVIDDFLLDLLFTFFGTFLAVPGVSRMSGSNSSIMLAASINFSLCLSLYLLQLSLRFTKH